jgi:hypothetical protein
MRRCVLVLVSVPALFLASRTPPAHAQEMLVSGGSGALLVSSDPCNNQFGPSRCEPGQVLMVALSPIVGVGGHRTTGGGAHGAGLRFGGWGEIASIGPNAGVLGGRMEAGIALGPLSVDLGAGVGLLWMDEQGREEMTRSFSFGAAAALRFSPKLSLSARASYHVAPDVAAAFAGITLDWFPLLPLFR